MPCEPHPSLCNISRSKSPFTKEMQSFENVTSFLLRTWVVGNSMGAVCMSCGKSSDFFERKGRYIYNNNVRKMIIVFTIKSTLTFPYKHS